jgi:hypothetical protein
MSLVCIRKLGVLPEDPPLQLWELRASSLTFCSWVRKSPRSFCWSLADALASSSVMTFGGRCFGVDQAANDPGVAAADADGPWWEGYWLAPPPRLPPVPPEYEEDDEREWVEWERGTAADEEAKPNDGDDGDRDEIRS